MSRLGSLITSFSRKSLIASLWLVGFLIVGANLAFSSAYAERIYPGVKVGAVDLGGLTRPQAEAALSRQLANYHISLKIDAKTIQVDPSDIGAIYQIGPTIESAMAVGHSQLLPLVGLLSNRNTHPLSFAYLLDKTKLHNFVERITSEQAEAPVDATVVVANGQLTVKPDQNGLGVDKDTLVSLLQLGVNAQTTSVNVNRTPVQADIRATMADQSAAEAAKIVSTPITLTYNDQTFTPTPAQIGSWLTFTKTEDNTLSVGFDTAQVKAYTASIAKGIDVAPVTEQVNVVNGVVQGQTDGVNGLAVDQDTLAKSITANLTAHTAGSIAITTTVVAFKTVYNRSTDLGSGKYVEINLTLQHLWAYDNNQVVYDTPITSGAVYYGLGTPTGLFAVYYKTTDFWMDGRNEPFPYYVHVDYWMPFDGAIGMHDASWRSSFGGQDYYSDGSHGCINMPHDAAAWMYGFADIGTPVWVHR